MSSTSTSANTSGTPKTSISDTTKASFKQAEMLSDDTRNRLNQISNNLNAQLSKKGSNITSYIKFDSDGCHKIIRFDPEKTEEVEVQFPGAPKPVKRVNLFGHEIVNGQVQGIEISCWTASPTAARDVLKLFKLNCFTAEITRHNMEKTNTFYDVQPYTN
jgi:hypothetical protein